jgi:hypothetical protein
MSAMRLEWCGAVAPKITAFPIAARFDPQQPSSSRHSGDD